VVEADGSLIIHDVIWDEEKVLRESEESATQLYPPEIAATCKGNLEEVIDALFEGRTDQITELSFGMSAINFTDKQGLDRKLPEWAVAAEIDLTQPLQRLNSWVQSISDFEGDSRLGDIWRLDELYVRGKSCERLGVGRNFCRKFAPGISAMIYKWS
jgi:hypothetical protein